MQITRRRFVSWLGASTVLGGASLAYGAASPAEALSTILRDSKPKTDKEKAAHGAAEAQPKHAATEHKQLTTAEEIWADLIEGNRRQAQDAALGRGARAAGQRPASAGDRARLRR